MGTSRLYNVRIPAPARQSLAVLCEEETASPLFGTTLRRRLYNLRHLIDPAFPSYFTVGEDAPSDIAEVKHPLEWVLAEGPRPDPTICFQRLRALWLHAENRGSQITNDPVLPFRHQAALIEFLSNRDAPRRVLIADEVGLGKTVEVGLLLRRLLRENGQLRVLYLTLGGLVENVLDEFHRLDLPRWYYFGNVSEQNAKRLGAIPIEALTTDTRLVVASIHKLGMADRFKEQRSYLAGSQFDLVVVDECHTLRAYGPAGESPQVWFSMIRELLDGYLAGDGRVLFLSATPHQGHREVFLNLTALCTGTKTTASEAEKAAAARGRVVFRIKEDIRDWEGKRIFPPRDVRQPILAEPPTNYANVLRAIADHFDWIAASEAGSQARAVGFVKSQALQYAASSLRAGFAYLLRRLLRYYPQELSDQEVQTWAARMLPYRGGITRVDDLLNQWRRELKAQVGNDAITGELSDDYANVDGVAGEQARLKIVLRSFNALFDDPNASTKFNELQTLLNNVQEPVVVFSQAVDTVYELEQRLRQTGVEVYRLTGDMLFDARPPVIQAFRTSKASRRVLVSSQAGGVGINLQVSRRVVHFDLPWNPMSLEQRVGRVHRIGSVQTILVDTILLRGSREAEVFERITQRLQDIVLDLAKDPAQREALFRRILASLDPESLRDLFSGARDLDYVGEAVEQGRRAVDEVDRDMRQLTATADVSQGLARTEHLLRFLGTAGATPAKVETRRYAVISEIEDGTLTSIEKTADAYSLTDADEPVVFDRVAAAYLQLKRSQTGGLGHESVDSFVRAAVDSTPDLEKAKLSAWVVAPSWPQPLQPGDIVLFSLYATEGGGTISDVRLRARVVNRDSPVDLPDGTIEQLLWAADFSGSRKAGDVRPFDEMLSQARGAAAAPSGIEWPIAAIGLRNRD